MSIVLKGCYLSQKLEYISVFMCSEINVIVSIYFRLDIGNIIREDCFQMLDICMYLHIAYLFPCGDIGKFSEKYALYGCFINEYTKVPR